MPLPRRKSNRLSSFNYSDAGWYFITICTQNMAYVFGEVIESKIKLNRWGNIVNNHWLQIPNHYSNVELDEFQIMPNHIHGIVVIRNKNINNVGAGYSRPKPTLGQIIGYFKYQSTKQINELTGAKTAPLQNPVSFSKIWQRSYYDHIIRNEHELIAIRQYIKNNPRNWEEDENKFKGLLSVLATLSPSESQSA